MNQSYELVSRGGAKGPDPGLAASPGGDVGMTRVVHLGTGVPTHGGLHDLHTLEN